jgi:hypothetical protein
MIHLGLCIQIILIFVCLSLQGQSALPGNRIFPGFTFHHASPVIAHDGNTLYFSVGNHPVNVGIDKYSDIWMSVKMPENGKWAPPFPLNGEINTPDKEFPVSIFNQSNSLLVRRDSRDNPDIFYDFNGSIWSEKEEFEFPDMEHPIKWATCNAFKTACFFIVRGISHDLLYVSVRDSSFTPTKPVRLKGFEKFKNIKDLTVSPDNRTIFFSAESESGFGGFDIYSSRRIGDHWFSWTQPLNAGAQVNSQYDEYQASVSVDGTKIWFTVKDSVGGEAIYQARLPVEVQAEQVIGIKVRGQLFAKNKNFEGRTKYYTPDNKRHTLAPIHADPLFYGTTTYLPASEDLLLVSEIPSFFIPSVQLPMRKGRNIYAANRKRKTYPGTFETEMLQLENQLRIQNDLISQNQKEIILVLQDIENGKSEIRNQLNKLPDIDVKPVEKELFILGNSYNMKVPVRTVAEAKTDPIFSDGAQRVQYWINEYEVNQIQPEDEDTIPNFQSFLRETTVYQWYANQMEIIRAFEREYEKEALARLRNLITDEDLDFLDMKWEDYIKKVSSETHPSIFQNNTVEESNNISPIWPVKNQMQLPFFNEMSLRINPLIENEIGNKVKASLIYVLSQQFYLSFLKEKKNFLSLGRKEITLDIEALEVRNQSKQELNQKDALIFEPLREMGDTSINLVAYPFDFAELIPLYVPFFPSDSIIPDIYGMFELNRLAQILTEYPGLGIEIAVQLTGNQLREGRILGERRIGFLDTFFEMAGIGSDRRNIHLSEYADQRTCNNLPIQLMIRFFYRN